MGFLSIFRRKDKAPEQPKPTTQDKLQITSVIAQSAHFNGDLVLHEGVKIEGTVRGNVEIDGDGVLVLTGTGVIEGNVFARMAIINGRIKGRASIVKLVLQKDALIDGELRYGLVKMAEGAEVTGSMTKDAQPQREFVQDAANVMPLQHAVS